MDKGNRLVRRIGAGVIGEIQIIRNGFSDRRLLARKMAGSSVGDKTTVHPSAYIADRGVIIGRGCAIGPECVIFENTVIEDDVEIGIGTVVGSQGYICKKHGKRITPVRHVGGVRIRRGAKIRSFCCIDKTVNRKSGVTEIGEGASLGDQIHVAHNARIGKDCRVASGAMIAGYVTIGDGAVVGYNASVSNRVTIGDRAVVMDGAVATKDVAADQRVSGNFAIDTKKHIAQVENTALGTGEGA